MAAIPQTDVRNREEHRKKRQTIEAEYNAQKEDYYDENGRVYPLQKVTHTHLVAWKRNSYERGVKVCGKLFCDASC